MFGHLNVVPFIMQWVVDPVSSIYASCASLKIDVQFLWLLLLARLSLGPNGSIKQWIITLAILTPFFHASTIYRNFSIIQHDITYAFAYSLFLGLLVYLILPELEKALHGKTGYIPGHRWLKWPLVFLLPFSGPLVAPCVLVGTAAILIYYGVKRQKIKRPSNHLVVLIGLSVYSIYLGQYNLESESHTIALSTAYERLFSGILPFLTEKLAFPLVIALGIINSRILNILGKPLNSSFWKIAVCFSLIFIILLPLGGYRDYRPDIIRGDTFLPITLILIFWVVHTSCQIVSHRFIWKRVYVVLLIGILAVFTVNDQPQFHLNDCEREMISKIHNSKDDVVELPDDCNLMNWHRIRNPKASNTNAALFKRWNVTGEKKWYYQKPND